MRIAFITDIHIGRPDENTYEVDVRANFEAVLADAVSKTPHFLILGGDLCFFQGDTTVYEWIESKLTTTGIPYFIISGNHDDPLMLAEAFNQLQRLQSDAFFYSLKLQHFPALFLDTTVGEVTPDQMDWLKTQLAQIQEPLLVFMHHPPLLAEVPFMDRNHALRNHEAVLALLERHNYPVDVFSGHYHVDKIIRHGQVTVYLTPSCFFQIDQYEPNFKVDHYRIGWRMIHCDTQRLLTTVHYL